MHLVQKRSERSHVTYLIKRIPFASAYEDVCLHSAGGYSIGLQVGWWLKFHAAVVKRTLVHLKDNRDSNLISFNVLKYLTVIIDYCAAYLIVTTMDVTDDPHPVLLSMSDNTLAHSWTTHTCKNSIIGQPLAKCFYFLLIDYKLGINSEWLVSTFDNYIADEVFCLKSRMQLLLNNFPLTILYFDSSILSLRTAVSFNRHQTCSPVSGTDCCTRSCQVSIK